MTYINANGRISQCHSVQMPDGSWISNPTIEQIHEAGWTEYVPPVVPQTTPAIETVVAALKELLSDELGELSDDDALAVAAMFPTWVSKTDQLVAAGERLWYDTKLYRVLQAHTVQPDWKPDVSPSLFAEVSIVEWPEWVQPISAETAYMTGDKVTYNGTRYVSLIDNNTWSPDDYPQGWEAQP